MVRRSDAEGNFGAVHARLVLAIMLARDQRSIELSAHLLADSRQALRTSRERLAALRESLVVH